MYNSLPYMTWNNEGDKFFLGIKDYMASFFHESKWWLQGDVVYKDNTKREEKCYVFFIMAVK